MSLGARYPRHWSPVRRAAGITSLRLTYLFEDLILPVIRSFKCQDTERLANDEGTGAFPLGVQKVGRRKLALLDSAMSLNDLRNPPGNRLEKLTNDRGSQHSIRINDQFRLCFRWIDGDAHDVEITDYHD